MIYEPLMELSDEELRSFRRVYLANPRAVRENARALVTSVGYGLTPCELWAKRRLNGFWERTRQESLALTVDEPSDGFFLNWPKWGTAWDGECGRLPTLEQGTYANECLSSDGGLLPTPGAWDSKGFWNRSEGTAHKTKGGCKYLSEVLMQELMPTPSAFDANGGTRQGGELYVTETGTVRRRYKKTSSYPGLAASLMPTPTRQDGISMHGYQKGKRETRYLTATGAARIADGKDYNQAASGYLNPNWLEWYMGLPPGWTEIE